MDRFAAMVILTGVIVSMVLVVLALFSVAPIICSCLVSLLYSLYLFMAYEESGVHDAQEFENQFWTLYAMLLCAALVFCRDSPLAMGLWSPTAGLACVAVSGYAMHLWDRHVHRVAMSQQTSFKKRQRQRQNHNSAAALLQLQDMGIQVSRQLERIDTLLTQIDQLLIPSTINNLINLRYVQQKEQEIVQIFVECDARALNYLLSHVKLGLLFYKIKDHRNFNGRNRTELINLLAVERLQILTVVSRVILLHSLQLLKLRANPRAEFWVQNILLHTHQDDLSELKTLTDAKGDYFSMNKLVYEDIRSKAVRETILSHFRKEAAVQETYRQMGRRHRRNRLSDPVQMRKVLSDVDDTLFSSGGMYPAGIDKRFARKTVYPGVLAFYRELDLGTQGPEEWEDDQVGNLVFLSARPHVYRDISEKHSIAKFERLQANTVDGRKGMHTTPSLMPGDLQSGSQYVMTNDFEPLARKKVDNFSRYVSIYPEYTHLFVCDNGQGDVRAAEIMYEKFPYEFEGAYVHVVQDVPTTYGYDPPRWRRKDFQPFFFRTYVEAALHAAQREPPLIRLTGLRRICLDSVKDFYQIKKSKFPSEQAREARRAEINLSIRRANEYLIHNQCDTVEYILAEQQWKRNEKVRSPYGCALIRDFDPINNLYTVVLDWRPLDVQLLEYTTESSKVSQARGVLETVHEEDDELAATAVAAASMQGGGIVEPVASASGATGENPIEEVQPTISEPLKPIRQVGGESSAEGGESSAEGDDRRPVFNPVLPEVAQEPEDPVMHPAEQVGEELTVESDSTESVDEASPTANADEIEPPQGPGYFSAIVSGNCIKRYSPPILPTVDKKKGGSMFPFLSKNPQAGSLVLKSGDQVTTAYGNGTVVEHQDKQGVVVVEMMGWNATAFLQEDSIKKSQKKRIFRSFLRQLSGSESTATPRPSEFPYVQGTEISTPFGPAEVEQPVQMCMKADLAAKTAKTPRYATIGLKLTTWKLANGTHAMMYCTVDTAQSWKDQAADGRSLFSKLNTLVSSSRTLLEPFLAQRKPAVDEQKLFEQYFKDSAAVDTQFGNGRIQRFRPTDGFYEVSLVNWTLSDGSHPTAIVQKDDIAYRVAKGCQEGGAVLFTIGLSGTLASIEPTTGVHIVTVQAPKMVCYLQPESILCPLKAAIGEDVFTPFGEGKVKTFCFSTNMYTITLSWGACLFATGDKFDRVGDGTQIRDGSFGVDWIFRLFFRPETSRSRSGSVTSARSGQ